MLAHHLKFMPDADLVEQELIGGIRNRAQLDVLQALAGVIPGECCADVMQRAANDG